MAIMETYTGQYRIHIINRTKRERRPRWQHQLGKLLVRRNTSLVVCGAHLLVYSTSAAACTAGSGLPVQGKFQLHVPAKKLQEITALAPHFRVLPYRPYSNPVCGLGS